MSQSQPKLQFVGQGKAKLITPLYTCCGSVPKEFITDGFSIPWFLTWFHHPFGEGLAGAIVHDFKLKQCDPRAHLQFYRLIRADGVTKAKATTMYISVVHYAKLKRLKHAITRQF